MTDGTKNACSKLYAACARSAKGMGYHKIQTYILESEPGTSLKASGWKKVADVRGRSWDSKFRNREDKHPTTPKTRWELILNPTVEGIKIDKLDALNTKEKLIKELW